MMIEHLGYPEAARMIEKAVEIVVAERKVLPRDLGGDATTQQMGKAIAELVKKL
jgi:tartrate dehydrogenase/decarboxylase/D-malate dehydrogenase